MLSIRIDDLRNVEVPAAVAVIITHRRWRVVGRCSCQLNVRDPEFRSKASALLSRRLSHQEQNTCFLVLVRAICEA